MPCGEAEPDADVVGTLVGTVAGAKVELAVVWAVEQEAKEPITTSRRAAAAAAPERD